jgi:dienelactone hydrolase
VPYVSDFSSIIQMTKKIYKGCGPPPLYGEDVTAAALVYKARNKRQFPNLFGEREAVEINPSEEDASNMTIEQRAMALATDNFARHGGIERLENGAFDTERVAFWVTYDPSLGGPTVAERIKKRALNNVKHWPSAFHYYAMKHAYINGASPKVEPWSLDRRTIIVAVRGTDNKQDRQLDKEAGHEMYWYRTSNAVGESSIYLNDVRPAVLNAQLRYPTESNDYFATGHSLGGALADELVRDGLVKGAVDFNPLISAFNSRLTADPELVHRIYTQDDIVFSILKSLLPKMALKRFNDTINIVPTVYKGVLASHSMDNFSAGLNENNLLTPPEGERYQGGGAHTLYHKTKLLSIIRRKRDGRYAVITNDTQKLHGWTTLTKAKKQMRLLYAVEHGWKPTHQIKGGATEEERGLAARIRESYDFQNVTEPWKLLLHAAHSIVHDASNEPIYTGRNDDGTHVINILRQLNTNTLPQYYPLITGPKRRTNNVFDTKKPIERASAAFRAFENQPPREARRFVAQPPPPSSVPPSDASKFRFWVKDN